jgi:hypothetical protein
LKETFRKPVAPRIVKTGPVKENILRDEEINLWDFPAPKWHKSDGGRYLDTFCGVVTQDRATGRDNIGLYRGQIIGRRKIGKLLIPTQGWGGHFQQARDTAKPMPVAVAHGWHDVLPFCAGSPFPKHICEWDMMGAILGRPVDLVPCETVPLHVPASAEIVVEGFIDPDPATFEAARKAGFSALAEEDFEGLGIRSVTLGAPRGMSIEEAMERLEDVAPKGDFTPNHIHLKTGMTGATVAAGAALAEAAASGGAEIGIIDGGVGRHPSLTGGMEQKGFAAGAPAPSEHGTAVASLAVGSGPVHGAAPGVDLIVADIYGRDPRGGNALALSKALAFMAARDVPVVGVSLVGPANPLVARIVEKVLARGTQIVAAVGNDGPAAPPAFPASYKGVVAVTGVDGKDRALIEAGRALHLDYAAPGADMAAADLSGGLKEVRGTSYAVPLVAGRLATAGSLSALDEAAKDLGPRGPDKHYGRGLVCGQCRTPLR